MFCTWGMFGRLIDLQKRTDKRIKPIETDLRHLHSIIQEVFIDRKDASEKITPSTSVESTNISEHVVSVGNFLLIELEKTGEKRLKKADVEQKFRTEVLQS